MDLPSLDGALGAAPAVTETESDSEMMRAQTTEEFLQVPTRRAGIEPVNPLTEAPPTAWEEPSLAPAPTDPIGAVSFDDTSGFFSDTPEAQPVAPIRAPKGDRKKPPVGLIGGALVVVLAAGILLAVNSTDSSVSDSPQEQASTVELREPDDLTIEKLEPPSLEAVVPPDTEIEEVVANKETGQPTIDSEPEEAEPISMDVAGDSEGEGVAAALPSAQAPSQPAAVKKTVKTKKKAKKQARKTTKKRPAPVVATDDNPWGVTDSTITATTGSLSITSSPPGATIWVDEKKRGITPLRLDLSFNTYNVRAELKGHKAQNIVVPVKTSSPSPIPFTMQPLVKLGKVQVSSQKHNGKALTMDGKSVGVIPLQIRDIAEGKHTFVVDGDSTTVQIIFNQNLTFSLSL